MRKKNMDKSIMEMFGAVISLLIISSKIGSVISTQTTPPAPASSTDMQTCQCGVFLLGTQPLVFSADAKPILSGLPVPANCSARDDKLQCASICRQLIETMSASNEDSPLVQTVVLAATRTLACQKYNESERVPLPRTIDATHSHHAKLDGSTNKWKFMVGPLARSDLLGEDDARDEDNEAENRLTKPKYLGGFYRWCDEHWIYAGVSLHEPLCCDRHSPRKCPQKESARNGRRPRLIIRRCKNDDCSSEEDSDFQSLDLITEKSTTTTTSSTTEKSNSEETEVSDNDNNDENNGTSSEVDTINPFDSTERPVKNRKPLNSTAVAEAFKFFTSLMDSIGYGDVVQGITSVLPASTAAELIDRVDVGGWVGDYQDRYMTWPREFGMGYCYLEYSLFNMANDGLSTTANNIMNRLFKNQRSGSAASVPANMNLLNPHYPQVNPQGLPQQPLPPHEMLPQPQPGIYPNNMNNINNYISSMAPLSENNFNYGPPGLTGNRRVKRGVTVSRSYSSLAGGEASPLPASSSSSSQGVRRAVRRKVVPRARNAPQQSSQSILFNSEPVSTTTTTTTTSTTNSPPVEIIVGNRTAFVPIPSSSFVPTHQQEPTSSLQDHAQTNPNYYQNQYYHYEVPQTQYPQNINQQYMQNNYIQRSHQPNTNPNPSLVEFARPRRNPVPAPAEQGNYHYPNPPQGYPQHPPPPPRSRQAQPQQQPQKKEGPSAGSLMNIANMLVQTAMSSGNNQNGGGDQVTNIMQNALPLVSQVATNPAIQNMVSSLVTSFLTPPQKSSPPPTPKPQPTSPSQSLDDDYEFSDDSAEEIKEKPVKEPVDSNELDNTITSSASNPKPTQSPPSSSSSSGEGGMLPNLLSQMVSTYVKYLLGGGPSNGSGGSNSGTKPSGINNRQPVTGTKPTSSEPKDVVEMICNVAKPFFISYFGVVPDDPGFGKLRINRNGHRHRSDKDGISANDILTNDPDPGTGMTDILFGSPNIPETGNSVIDFGNRVVYAFHSANDAQNFMYCFKQYSVNKLWDYFRVGVKAVFKK